MTLRPARLGSATRCRRAFLAHALATTTLLGVSSLGWKKTWGNASRPVGLSLHCGLNHFDDKFYGGVSSLRGCHNDARDMQRIAETMRYQQSIALLDDAATRYEVVRHISWAAQHLTRGDTFFISVSSHGTAIENPNSNELDKTDEAWCLFDNLLLDHEFYALFKQFVPGVKVLLVLDTCHSGTSYEAINFRRKVDRDLWDLPDLVLKSKGEASSRQLRTARNLIGRHTAPRELPNHVAAEIHHQHSRDFTRRRENALQQQTRRKSSPAGLMLVACLDGETALDGSENGLFTYALKRSWETGRFRTYADLFFKGILGELMGTAQTPLIYPFGSDRAVWKDLKPFQA